MSGAQFATREHERRRAERAPTVAPPGPLLTVGHAEDPAECEADRIADAVIARLQPEQPAHDTNGQVQRTAVAPEAQPEVGIEGGSLSAALSDQITAQRGNGAPLTADVRARMEGAFGTSLASVRVHTGSAAATLNGRVSARAFTTGQDIFFGAGEYRPDTPEGERTLAHEIAHTRQAQAGVHRQTIRRLWNLSGKNKLVLSDTKEIKANVTRNVYFFTHKDGDKMVIKPESEPFGVAELSNFMQTSFANTETVTHRRLSKDERGGVFSLVSIPGLTSDPSWAQLGAAKRAEMSNPMNPYYKPHWDAIRDQGDNAEVGRAWARMMQTLPPPEGMAGEPVLAMSFAKGKDAHALASTQTAEGGSEFRNLIAQPKIAEQLGEMTAVDLFMGNQDRIISGNMGNWFHGDDGGITVIDMVDSQKIYEEGADEASTMAKRLRGPANFGEATTYDGHGTPERDKKFASLHLLAKAQEAALWAQVNRALEFGMQDRGDNDITTWFDEKVGKKSRREIFQGNFMTGLRRGRKKLIATFTATRRSITKSGRRARALKKDIKGKAQAAAATDAAQALLQGDDWGGVPDYYQQLKARALWLKKN